MRLFWTHYFVAGAVLAVGTAAVYGFTALMGRQEYAPPLKAPLAKFPRNLGPANEWERAREGQMGADVREILNPIDALDREYKKELSATRSLRVNLFVAYFDGPSKAMKHPPDVCFPSQGFNLIRAETVKIRPTDGVTAPFNAQRLIYRKGEGEDFQLVLYWIDSAGGSAASSMWLRFVAAASEFKGLMAGRNVNWAAKIMVTAPIRGTGDEAALQAASEFASLAQPELAKNFFPGVVAERPAAAKR